MFDFPEEGPRPTMEQATETCIVTPDLSYELEGERMRCAKIMNGMEKKKKKKKEKQLPGVNHGISPKPDLHTAVHLCPQRV